MIALSIGEINRKCISYALVIGLHIVIPSNAALAQSAVVCDRIGSRVVCKQKRTLLDALNNFADTMSEQREARENKRQRDLENERAADYQRREEERLRIEIENAQIERQRIEILTQKQNTKLQEEQYARQAEQDLRDRVSTAVLEGRCEDAKTIALIASRLDMAEQALRICKPQATKPPLAGATSKKQVGQVVPQPKVVARVSQTKSSSPHPAPSRLTQPTVVAPPSKPTPDQEAFKLAMTAAAQGYNNSQYNVAKMYAEGRGVTQNDAAAVSWYRAAAEQGNFKAQSALGLMYDTGRGVTQSYAAAVIWYTKAAEQGYAISQYNLGVMYANGLGVAQDDAVAVSWYRKAAEQGDLRAQSAVGLMYDTGRGVTQSYPTAVIWYTKAAEQGYSTAQYNLGVMYANGLGVAQDLVQAYKWFSLAGAADASVTKNKDIVAAKMQPAQVAEAQRLASEWRKK